MSTISGDLVVHFGSFRSHGNCGRVKQDDHGGTSTRGFPVRRFGGVMFPYTLASADGHHVEERDATRRALHLLLPSLQHGEKKKRILIPYSCRSLALSMHRTCLRSAATRS